MAQEQTQAGPGRIPLLDILRSLALAAMIVFHTTRDLETFDLIEAGTTGRGGWYVAARLIAGSFLFIAGCSLALAHRDGLRWRRFAVRLAQLVLAAALVSLATWLAMPGVFVRFGILHCIAAASVIGLAFLGRPPALTAAAAAAAVLAPMVARSAIFDAPALIWTGLATTWPPMLDFVPVLPWIGPFLLGLAAATWADRAGVLPRLGAIAPRRPALARWLAWPGRHSLAIYLIHQPLILGLVWAWSRSLG